MLGAKEETAFYPTGPMLAVQVTEWTTFTKLTECTMITTLFETSNYNLFINKKKKK